MRFSIIIRTHNRHDMLQRAIMSARKAKMDEIVVAADPHCSEKVRNVVENTPDITKVWCKGGGLGAAWAEANLQCSNEWIKILDDDDEMLHDARDTMSAHIAKYKAEAYRCQTTFVNLHVDDRTGVRTDELFYFPPRFNGMSWKSRSVLRRVASGQPLYHKSLIDVIGNIDPSLTWICEDYDWALRSRGRLLVCPDAVVLVHTHGTNTSLKIPDIHDALRTRTRVELRYVPRRTMIYNIPWLLNRRNTDRAHALYRVVWSPRTDKALARVMAPIYKRFQK